jgi:predicted nucleic acid-binding protein
VTGWLLDTNILSELRRVKPDPKVVRFVTAQPLDFLFVSAVTFAETRFGIELVGDPIRRAELNEWLTHKLRPMFEARVLPISEEIMFIWRLLVEEGRKVGHTFSQPDLIIAATGLHHGLTIVTRDTGDYARTRVPVLNPWSMHCQRRGYDQQKIGKPTGTVVLDARNGQANRTPSGFLLYQCGGTPIRLSARAPAQAAVLLPSEGRASMPCRAR